MTVSHESGDAWSWLPFYTEYTIIEASDGTTLNDGKAASYRLWWIGMLVVYAIYYCTIVITKPKVVCSGKKLKEAIAEHCPIFFECYWPTIWAFNNHLMTVLRARLQHSPKAQYKRHMLRLYDGGQLALDWLKIDRDDITLPVLVILPGLTGSSQDNYVRYLAKDGESQGFRPVVFNQRGNGGVEMLTPRTYNATNTEDLCEVISHVRSSYPDVPIVGLGVSLGAVLLTRYLAETGDKSELAGVMAISSLWDAVASNDGMKQFPSRQLYNWFLSHKMRSMVERNVPRILSKFQTLPYDINEILKGSLVSDYDQSCTIKVFGYPNTTKYYEDVSNKHRLCLVKKPMICIQAEDDPFAPHHTLPYTNFEENENTVLVTTSRGGHFGFLEGFSPFGMTWMNRAVQQSLSALKHTNYLGNTCK